ncbi:unnamed protein product [Gongylonema pulchrum]|uniref:Uncharacterized protein n=1 Tax=Gongylonema pulchrum TaxID=637853 RepID=A0A3P7NV36_9BILA|nr:unnamed protein product [Gongylonema pulchrum]
MTNGDAHGNEKPATSAGRPLTKQESNDGRKKLLNGMWRVHRIMTEEERAQGKQTRWTELEIRVTRLDDLFGQLQRVLYARYEIPRVANADVRFYLCLLRGLREPLLIIGDNFD